MANPLMTSSGYESRFRRTPPDDLTCLICHCVTRDPQQIQCCAHLYCKTCLNEERLRTNQCPTCRQPIRSFSDKLSHRRIKALRVSCDNEDNGCTWSGELRSLEAHSAECQFSLVTCPNCSAEIVRHWLKYHTESECPQRDYTCRLCNLEGKYCDITTTHMAECPNDIVHCPNTGCSTDGRRCEVSKHRQSCPKEVVKCSYAKVGCKKEMVREECKKHEADNVELHLQLAVDRISALSSKQTVVPVVFKLPDFGKRKDSNDVWYSERFYSHPGGYGMILSVDANGDSEESHSHLSVYVYLAGGEYDDNLVWPFNGTITIELLNQLEDRNHTKMELEMNVNKTKNANRPPQGDRNKGYGWPTFIPHTALAYTSSNNCQYLKDDCLYFRVTNVDLNPTNTTKPWLAVCPNVGCAQRVKRCEAAVHRRVCPKERVVCTYSSVGCQAMPSRDTLAKHIAESTSQHLTCAMEELVAVKSVAPVVFKLLGFENLKVTEDVWYSPPFYSHQGGYKMCLSVDTTDSGDDGHVSFYIYLIGSKNDKNLLWPFRGEVHVELLNQRDDREHFGHILEYTPKELEDHNVAGEMDEKSEGWGCKEFIPYSLLSCRSNNSYQHLKDDTLYFRVSRVTVFKSNKPWLTSAN